MDKQKANIIWFKDLNIEAVPLVGGKNAALGEMFANLTKLGINVPNGFAVTAKAYNEFLDKAGIRIGMEKILKDLDTGNMRALQKAGKKVRRLILKSSLPKELEYEISAAYRELG
ncbi:MAG: Pyruvate water dikinase, partial [Candidatus Giovannonibacteria bacterium GW2011_GWA2_45_21]